MTEYQKEQIGILRHRGLSYRDIAAKLDLKTDTVRKHCLRNKEATEVLEEDGLHCRHCGKLLPLRRRVFCSEECRRAWWAANPNRINKRKVEAIQCVCCGKVILDYPFRHRRFCSHSCYIDYRYGTDRKTPTPLVPVVLPTGTVMIPADRLATLINAAVKLEVTT